MNEDEEEESTELSNSSSSDTLNPDPRELVLETKLLFRRSFMVLVLVLVIAAFSIAGFTAVFIEIGWEGLRLGRVVLSLLSSSSATFGKFDLLPK